MQLIPPTLIVAPLFHDLCGTQFLHIQHIQGIVEGYVPHARYEKGAEEVHKRSGQQHPKGTTPSVLVGGKDLNQKGSQEDQHKLGVDDGPVNGLHGFDVVLIADGFRSRYDRYLPGEKQPCR